MLKYIAKRIGVSILILIGVSMIIYFLIRLMPVDFIQDKINAMNQGGAVLPEETVKKMYAMYGLGDNTFLGILSGYFTWLGKLFTLDLGDSWIHGSPVAEVIKDHMGVSFAVSLIATFFELQR